MERLASGLRVNSSMDDAAGLSISNRLGTKILSLSKATSNANDAISLIHLAEKALDAVSDMLIRMRELSTQSMNGTYSDANRANLNEEFQQLSREISRISDNTFFNGISVIGYTDTLDFQVGYENNDSISLNTRNISSDRIGTIIIDHELDKPVATISPPTGATDVALASNLYITFNEDVFESDGTAIVDADLPSLVTLQNSSGTAVSATMTISNGVVTIDPSSNLTDGETYTLSVSGFQDEEGYVGNSTSATFTANVGVTQAQATANGYLDPTQLYAALPSVNSLGTISPPTGAVDVDSASDLYITLSGDDLYDMSGNVLSDADIFSMISISSSDDPNVSSLLNGASFSRSGDVITISPTQNMLDGASYTLSLSGAYELPAASFQNGTFDLTGEVNNGDGTYSIPGWTIYDQRMNLGTTSVGGSVSPDDGTYPSSSPGNDDTSVNSISFSHYAGSNGLVLQLSGQTSVGYGVVHGPYIASSNNVAFKEGAVITMDWLATGGGDAYDVFGYLLKDDGNTITLIDRTGTSTSGGDSGTLTHTITASEVGNYKFVFTGGTYDLSGGQAVGATFEISNLAIANNTQTGTITDRIQGPHSVSSTFTAYDTILANTEYVTPPSPATTYTAAAPAAVYTGEPVIHANSDTIAEADISTLAGATSALTVVNNAIAMIDDYRVDLGSVGNRLDFAVMNLYSRIEYQAAAKSRVLDADYAVESARLAKSQVLQSAGTAMLAQANASSANVMSLLK